MVEVLGRETTSFNAKATLSKNLHGASARNSPSLVVVKKRCCGRLVDLLFAPIWVAIAALVVFSIFRSTQVSWPNSQDNSSSEDVPVTRHDHWSMRETPPSSRNQALANENVHDSEYLVQPTDFIYQNLPGEAAPIVLEDYKLVFFAQAKVGCTVWKLLFRRMMGYANWRQMDLVHARAYNGLKYLDHYNLSYASHMMTSPEWTRAIILRDPKERFLSAYLDKAVESQLFLDTCCNQKRQVYCNPVPPSLQEFLTAIRTCPDSHWNPQSQRMEPKYWKYINFVGYMDTVQDDAKRLLMHLQVWRRFGQTGWGKDRKSAVFDGGDGLRHANNANDKVQEYLYPELEQQLEEFYAEDYQHPLFKFPSSVQMYSDAGLRSAVNHDKLALPFVEPRDCIYRRSKLNGEASPIVLEKFKLVFFAVPHVAENEFKRLFRRMMGQIDWKTRTYDKTNHDAINEGLMFLRDFNLTKASEIMKDPTYTKAIFVRDPKERFAMAYSKVAVGNRQLLHQICCFVAPRYFCMQGKGTRAILLSIPNSTEFLKGIHTCKSTQWDPIIERMGALRRMGIHVLQTRAFDNSYFSNHKYWKTINFVGNMDTAYEDARALLERLGAWREFGESGWADTPEEATIGLDAFFNTSSFLKQELRTKVLIPKVIIDPQMEESLERLYAQDYGSPWFNLTRKVLFKTSGATFLQETLLMRKELEKIQKDISKKANMKEWD